MPQSPLQTAPTRTSAHWPRVPGSFDTLHARQLFPADNLYDFPTLQPTILDPLPDWCVPYRVRVRNGADSARGGVHFCVDDYRFEAVWNRPETSLAALAHFGVVCTPDFSLYRDYPIAAQIWNTYRSRWCGAYWQSRGLVVVPTISWSTPRSYAFAFAGITPGSAVAISTVGLQRADVTDRQMFAQGFAMLMTTLRPRQLLCFGPPPDGIPPDVALHVYPTHWDGLHAARRTRRVAGSPLPDMEGA